MAVALFCAIFFFLIEDVNHVIDWVESVLVLKAHF